jgi:hypothetical protein
MYKQVGINYDDNTLAIMNRERLPKIPKNKIAGRINLNGDFSFDNIEDSIYYISEWHRLAIENPSIMFFGYTKSWQDERLLPYLEDFKNLNNVVLRASVDDKTGYNVPNGWTIAGRMDETTIDKAGLKNKKYFVCQFNNKNHALYKKPCDTCKVCLKKSCENIPVLFPSHD